MAYVNSDSDSKTTGVHGCIENNRTNVYLMYQDNKNKIVNDIFESIKEHNMIDEKNKVRELEDNVRKCIYYSELINKN